MSDTGDAEKTPPGAGRNRNIWAPWRMEYIEALGQADKGCFLCSHRDEPEKDESNFVLWRGQSSFAVLNRFPYTGGHSMIAPYEHVGDLAKVPGRTMLEMMELARDLQIVLTGAVHAQGFNIGMNIGRCAGAGLPGHLHIHVVPRWDGDTNFIAVLDDVRVIPQALGEIYDRLRETADEMNLPRLSQGRRA